MAKVEIGEGWPLQHHQLPDCRTQDERPVLSGLCSFHDITLPALASFWAITGLSENIQASGNEREFVVLSTCKRNKWPSRATDSSPVTWDDASVTHALLLSLCRLCLMPFLHHLWFQWSWSNVSCHSIPVTFLHWQNVLSLFFLQKANEATRFPNYSLIWPRSSPLHKYTLIR